jgi:hypothetical protein
MAVVEKEYLEGGGWVEVHDDGRRIYKNAAGQVIKNEVPKEAAAAMGRAAAAKKAVVESEDVGDLLQELELSESGLAKMLAGQFMRGGIAGINAVRELIKLSPKLMATQKTRPPEDGEQCHVCRRVYHATGSAASLLSEASYKRLLKMFADKLLVARIEELEKELGKKTTVEVYKSNRYIEPGIEG